VVACPRSAWAAASPPSAPRKAGGLSQSQCCDKLVALISQTTGTQEKQPVSSGNHLLVDTLQDADLLRCSASTAANFERRGKLHPERVRRPDSRDMDHRVAVYDPEELPKLPLM